MFLQIVFAALTVLLALVFYIDTLDLPEAAYELPRILIVLVVLLAIAMVLERWLWNKKKTLVPNEDSYGNAGLGHRDGSPENSTSMFARENAPPAQLPRVLLFILLTTGYLVTIERLGYFIVTPLYIIATYLHLKATNFRNIIFIAIGFTVFVYMLFVFFLHLPIPMGLLS